MTNVAPGTFRTRIHTTSRIVLVIVLLLLLPSSSHGKGRPLEFVGEIGGKTERLGWMSFVSFSDDGTMVAANGQASANNSDDVAIWSFPEGRLIKRLPIRPTVLSLNWKDYADFHGVGEVEPAKVQISLPANGGATYAFSPNGRYVAESTRRQNASNSIHIVELHSGKEVRAFGHLQAWSLAISPNGHILAAGYWNSVTLWDVVSGKRLAVLRGFGRYVDGIAFSRNGKLLAAGTDAGGLQIWNVRSRHRIQALEIGGGYVSTPAFSPNGSLVAIGIYGTGTVWLIDVETGRIVDHQKVSDIGCGSVAFSPNGRFLITPSTGGLIKWPYDLGGTIRVFRVNAY